MTNLTAEQRYRQALAKTRLQDERACRAFMAGEVAILNLSGERENIIAELERAYRAGFEDGRRA